MMSKARATNPLTAILALLLSLVIYVYVNPPQYVFSPETLHSIARKAIAEGASSGLNTTIASVLRQLEETYPGRILENAPWMFNNAGGAMGAMLVLHCSLMEYVIIFGTALGTEGHTGRFLADDYFYILHGEQWAFPAGSLEKEVYGPGDGNYLPRGSAKQYKMPDSAWALEYARGHIITMLPFGLGDSFTSTFDVVTVWQTVCVSLRGYTRELRRMLW